MIIETKMKMEMEMELETGEPDDPGAAPPRIVRFVGENRGYTPYLSRH